MSRVDTSGARQRLAAKHCLRVLSLDCEPLIRASDYAERALSRPANQQVM
jgi:hypothetical protein